MRTTLAIAMLFAVVLAGCSSGAANEADADDADTGSAGAGDAAVAEPAPDIAAPAAGAVAPVAQGVGTTSMAAGDAGGVPAGITVSGAGQASGTPDVVRVTVGVTVVRETVDAALDAANAATERVIAVLDDAGIPDEDRQTREFSINPEYGGDGPDGPRITGYSVSNLVEAKIRDVDAVGGILTDVANAGGNDTQIRGVSFALEDDGAQVTAARQAAFADARARAEQYAELAGVSLGGLIGITDTDVSSPQPVEAFAAEAARADVAVPIEPGSQQVTVRVTVRWALDG